MFLLLWCFMGCVTLFWHKYFFFLCCGHNPESIQTQHMLNHYKSILNQFKNVHTRVYGNNNLVKKSMFGIICVSLTSLLPIQLPASWWLANLRNIMSWVYIIFIGKRILEVDFPPLNLYCADLYPAQGVLETACFMLRKPVATAFWKQMFVDKITE